MPTLFLSVICAFSIILFSVISAKNVEKLLKF